jgi:hypothetical protein
MLPGRQIDTVQFDRNPSLVGFAALKPYFGKRGAWNAEGTEVLAAGADGAGVLHHLDAQVSDPLSTVLDHTPHADASSLE